MNNSTTFTVTVSPQQARTRTIEHCVEETIRAMFGVNSSVLVNQLDDTTLQITVTPSTRFQLAFK